MLARMDANMRSYQETTEAKADARHKALMADWKAWGGREENHPRED